jgi:hypothetical protein
MDVRDETGKVPAALAFVIEPASSAAGAWRAAPLVVSFPPRVSQLHLRASSQRLLFENATWRGHYDLHFHYDLHGCLQGIENHCT